MAISSMDLLPKLMLEICHRRRGQMEHIHLQSKCNAVDQILSKPKDMQLGYGH